MRRKTIKIPLPERKEEACHKNFLNTACLLQKMKTFASQTCWVAADKEDFCVLLLTLPQIFDRRALVPGAKTGSS